MWCICSSLKWKFYIFISPPLYPHQYHIHLIRTSFLRQDEDGSLYLTTRYFPYSNFYPSTFFPRSFFCLFFSLVVFCCWILFEHWSSQVCFEILSGQDALFYRFIFPQIALPKGKKQIKFFDTNKQCLSDFNNYWRFPCNFPSKLFFFSAV